VTGGGVFRGQALATAMTPTTSNVRVMRWFMMVRSEL
jgi:hypothetical protein